MRRFRGLKFHSPRQNSGKTSFSSSGRNTATRFACCKSADRLARLTVIRWSSAAAPTCRSTGEIGPFRIVKEEAIAAGTRRIEAVAGDAARAWAKQEAARQQEKFETLARKKPDIAALPAFQDDAATAEMLKQIDARAAHLEKVDAEVREWEKKTAKSAEAELKSRAAQIANDLAQSHAGQKFLRRRSTGCGWKTPSRQSRKR